MKRFDTYFLMLMSLLISTFSGCGDMEPNFSNNPNLKLSFSTDTLRFDTIFAPIASPTRTLMVYNKNNKPLKIEKIQQSNTSNSGFRINVDGRSGDLFEGIEIAAKDSLYIFVEITPPSIEENNPLILNTDSILFFFNGNTQYVRLEAPSKKAIWLHGGIEIRENHHFTAEIPYLIYDSIVVNPGVTLSIEKGAKFYMHGDAFFSIYGSLQCEGNISEPIIFRGDRFDDFIKDIPFSLVPGQWGGIIIKNPTHSSKLLNTELLNSSFGLIALNDETERKEPISLTLINCKLHNAKNGLLFTRNINTQIFNTEISNSGGKMIVLNEGAHKFIHCTLANFFRWSSRLAPSYNFKTSSSSIRISLKNTILDGTIVHSGKEGDLKSELFVSGESENITLTFDHCYLSTNIEQLKKQSELSMNDCLINAPVLSYALKGFNDELQKTNYIYDFRPLESDVVVGKASPALEPLLMTDRLGISRTIPDIGAYQHIIKTKK